VSCFLTHSVVVVCSSIVVKTQFMGRDGDKCWDYMQCAFHSFSHNDVVQPHKYVCNKSFFLIFDVYCIAIDVRRE